MNVSFPEISGKPYGQQFQKVTDLFMVTDSENILSLAGRL